MQPGVEARSSKDGRRQLDGLAMSDSEGWKAGVPKKFSLQSLKM